MTIPLITYIAPVTSLAIVATLIAGLQAVLNKGAFNQDERAAYLRNGVALVFGWFLLALALSWLEFFRGSAQSAPTIEFGIFAPIAIGAWLVWRSRPINRLIDAAPQSWIIGVQLYRALGLVFLILMARGELPGEFAWPAGVGDVIVGVTAPFVAMAFARGAPHREQLAYVWNVFGLLDLMVAVSAGFLTSPSPIQMLALSAPNVLISAFPLALIPVFAVPVSVLLHIVSLIKLARESQSSAVHA